MKYSPLALHSWKKKWLIKLWWFLFWIKIWRFIECEAHKLDYPLFKKRALVQGEMVKLFLFFVYDWVLMLGGHLFEGVA